MKKQKLTPLQKEYQHQQKRLKNAQRKLEKQGFMFDNSNIIPEKPARLTKKFVQQLQQIKPKQLAKSAEYLNPFTGELLTGQEAVNFAKQRSTVTPVKFYGKRSQNQQQSLPSEADMVISNYRAEIRNFPAQAEPLLTRWLDELISLKGKDEVATMLQDGAEHGYIVNYKIAYSSTQLFQYMSAMVDYLPSPQSFGVDKLMDELEYYDGSEE